MTRRPTLPIAALLAALFLGVATPASAQDRWTSGTASTVAEGRWEMGVFGPLRYGLNDHVEVSTHPGWDLIAPNVRAKIRWVNTDTWEVATTHALTYPTMLLRTLSRSGAGGVLPATAKVPQAVVLDDAVIATAKVAGGLRVSMQAGLLVAPRFGDSHMPTIDFPFVYPRTAALHSWGTPYAGIQLQRHFRGDGPRQEDLNMLGAELDMQTFWMPEAGDMALEISGKAFLDLTARTRVQLGFLFSVGSYPFGWDTRTLPTADVLFAW